MALNPEDMPIEVSQGALVTRYVELGDMAIRHATLPAGTDMAPVLQGLPGDRCPSPHWGIILTGSISIEHERRFRDRGGWAGLPLAGRAHRRHGGRCDLHRGRPRRADARLQ